jgi:YidC/Oxa1 family membrane protein insertase
VWTSLVELVRAAIFAGTHLVCGSLGAAVILVSAAVRLALLPLVLRGARHARLEQAKLEALRPQLERLQVRFKSDSRRLLAETQALYRAHNVRPFGGFSLTSALIQLPLLGALFSAVRSGLGARVRFLWIGDLSRVDTVLVVIVTALAGTAASITPSAPGSPIQARTVTVMAAAATLLFLWSASSAVALSVGAGSAVSVLQNWLLRRDARSSAALS